MTWALYEMFGAFEFMFEQARQRALPTDVWDRWAATMAWWVSYPGVQTWWEVKPTPFNPRFSSFVDDLIARSGPATPSAMRWQEFVAQAGGSLFDEPGAVS